MVEVPFSVLNSVNILLLVQASHSFFMFSGNVFEYECVVHMAFIKCHASCLLLRLNAIEKGELQKQYRILATGPFSTVKDTIKPKNKKVPPLNVRECSNTSSVGLSSYLLNTVQISQSPIPFTKSPR